MFGKLLRGAWERSPEGVLWEDTPRDGPALLSICIPTFQRGKILRRTLEHLAANGGAQWEIVVSDNASADDTEATVKAFRGKFRGLRYARQAANRGPAANSDTCMRLATGRYLYLLCDDDRVLPAGIAAALAALAADSGVAAVFGGHQEWDPVADRVLKTLPLTERKLHFERGARREIFAAVEMLWCPVIRREVFQRHCFYDANTFGYWRLVSQILAQGAIEIVPECLYQHAHTVPRMEFELTESWYHDCFRADHEIYLFDAGMRDLPGVAQTVAECTVKAYRDGARYAKLKLDPLRERFFLHRAAAYGIVDDERLREWEKASLLRAAMMRLAGTIGGLPGVRSVVVEAGPMSDACCEALREILGAVSVEPLPAAEFMALAGAPQRFFLAMEWSSLQRRAECHPLQPEREAALYDLAASLRLTETPLEQLGWRFDAPR
jgi:glycosyltransferase involved in cell wall biosynthesis